MNQKINAFEMRVSLVILQRLIIFFWCICRTILQLHDAVVEYRMENVDSNNRWNYHSPILFGAQVNLNVQATFESLPRILTLESLKGKLYVYQTDKPIRIKGYFNVTVQANGHKTEASFKVVDERVCQL